MLAVDQGVIDPDRMGQQHFSVFLKRFTEGETRNRSLRSKTERMLRRRETHLSQGGVKNDIGLRVRVLQTRFAFNPLDVLEHRLVKRLEIRIEIVERKPERPVRPGHGRRSVNGVEQDGKVVFNPHPHRLDPVGRFERRPVIGDGERASILLAPSVNAGAFDVCRDGPERNVLLEKVFEMLPAIPGVQVDWVFHEFFPPARTFFADGFFDCA